MIDQVDAYKVLQVDPTAELIVIKAAYRALARRYHEDGDSPDVAKMAELNRAYETLRNPVLRSQHDEERARSRTRAVPIAQPQPPAEAGWSRPTAAATRSGSPVIDFGRYEGWSIADLARRDPDYLRWLSRHSSGIRYRSAINAALPRDRSGVS